MANPLSALSPWGLGLGIGGDILSMLIGSRMPSGQDVALSNYNKMMQQGALQMNQLMPQMAANYYQQMMGGALGRGLRMNALQAGRAAQSGMGSALGGTGLMHGGLGGLGRGLANSVQFSQLSNNQMGLNNLAWQMAQNNMGGLMGGAFNFGQQAGMGADARKWGLIGAGFGGLGDLASRWTK